MKYISKLVIFIFSILMLSSCTKPDRLDHEDQDYLYVWEYKIGGDSILQKYHKPRTVEYRVWWKT